jgi:hypothetical protein
VVIITAVVAVDTQRWSNCIAIIATPSTTRAEMVSKSRACFTLLYVFLSLATNLADAVAISPGVAWSWYRTMLKEHPLTTKSTTSSVIMTVSDVICQELTRGNQVVKDGKKADIDYLRVLHVFGVDRLVIIGMQRWKRL